MRAVFAGDQRSIEEHLFAFSGGYTVLLPILEEVPFIPIKAVAVLNRPIHMPECILVPYTCFLGCGFVEIADVRPMGKHEILHVREYGPRYSDGSGYEPHG